MKILLLGGGGREHALALKLSQSPRCEHLFIAPGNPGTAMHGTNVAMQVTDFQSIKSFCVAEKIEMVVVGPEDPLVAGIWDFFKKDDQIRHISVIGPSAFGAQLEGSKAWAKAFMNRHKIPTAAYQEFTQNDVEKGVEFLKKQTIPIVLKADGLAAGKGVVICENRDEAISEFREMLGGKFGSASAKVVVEQFLDGIEFSVFVLTDGHSYKILPEAKDYKRIGEGDSGPNTGGMGAVSPVSFATRELMQKVEKNIIKPTIRGLKKEKIDYIGFVFIGLIVVENEPFVIEYNCRMGDPETEVVMPRLKNDLVELLEMLSNGQLSNVKIKTERRAAATVFLVSGGYPGDFQKGKLIKNWEKIKGSTVFHAGTKQVGDQILTNGGRVMAVTSMAANFEKAVEKSVKNAAKIKFAGRYFRTDIGKDLAAFSNET
jgi:phosphoribosylamine---glycine ligase